ncbi:MAG: double-strand break repair protein AddB, partial [Marinibacterium sp.]
MFEPGPLPRLFALPPGVDFPRALIAGLDDRLAGQPPEALARVTLIVNTRRMFRRLREVYDSGPARLLPRIRLVTDLDDGLAEGPPAVPRLRRRLELAQLVDRLLTAEPDLAPREALFDLTDSLAGLFEEMSGEGVTADAIAALDVSDQSGHWARAQRFLSIASAFADPGSAPDGEARRRAVVEALCAHWADQPPTDPILLAGSTGSRGTTHRLMQAIARLHQGAVVLPGFDFDLPADVWAGMGREDHAFTAEDHPQYRFFGLMDGLGIGPDDVRRWTDEPPPAPDRNAVLSLALRPAPVTDAWLTEGAHLPDLSRAMTDVTLIEAADPRAQAQAIALRLRQAAEDGQKAALITPDRMLTRQVQAALDRWDIVADDSAGQPLHLAPPGRLLRQIADLAADKVT